jgi:hypothetical protein
MRKQFFSDCSQSSQSEVHLRLRYRHPSPHLSLLLLFLLWRHCLLLGLYGGLDPSGPHPWPPPTSLHLEHFLFFYSSFIPTKCIPQCSSVKFLYFHYPSRTFSPFVMLWSFDTRAVPDIVHTFIQKFLGLAPGMCRFL